MGLNYALKPKTMKVLLKNIKPNPKVMENPYQILFQKLQEMDAKITKISASLSKQEETYLTTAELASRLGVSRQTVWKLTKDQVLRQVQVGRSKRYRLSEVEAVLDT